jgi:hypothetical protein
MMDRGEGEQSRARKLWCRRTGGKHAGSCGIAEQAEGDGRRGQRSYLAGVAAVRGGCERPSFSESQRETVEPIDGEGQRKRTSNHSEGTMNEVMTGRAEVTVVDIKMPFGSMVLFILKWTLASIPAVIIIMLIAFALAAMFGGMFTALTG